MKRIRWYRIVLNDGAGDEYRIRAESRSDAWRRLCESEGWFGDVRHEIKPMIRESGKPNYTHHVIG